MSLWRSSRTQWRSALKQRMEEQRARDAEMEMFLGIERTHERSYSRRDIEDLEREKLGLSRRH